MNFSSDTSAPVHSAIMTAMVEASRESAPSYGADRWCELAKQRLADVFETDVGVWFAGSGTAANALGLSVLCPPAGSVICHADAHIEKDERGAVGFFSGGGILSLLPGDHGKLTAETLARRLKANRPDFVHETPAHVLSLSNLTESGTAYSHAEVSGMAELAHAHGLSVHMDGARFANAVAFCGASPADMSWRAGVDVMSFGVTKNGAAGCEAVLLFGEMRKRQSDLETRAKRSGHMPAKLRLAGAQMAASLDGGLWLDLARTANTSARDLAQVLTGAGEGKLLHEVQGNEVFVSLPEDAARRLQKAGALFYPWADGSFRFVCSWATTPAEVAAVAAVLS